MLETALKGKNIYYYCSVLYENNPFPYHYRTDNISSRLDKKVYATETVIGRYKMEVKNYEYARIKADYLPR